MLLFSTVLDIKESFTADDMIKLVLEWNETSKYIENRVTGIEWKGEHTVRYGTDALWLEFVEYTEKSILAVRHEKRTADGVVWDSDFIMDFARKQMAIQLDRTYHEEALVMNAAFSTPHFISLLIQHDYLRDDCGIPVLRKPIYITDADMDLCRKSLTKEGACRLPVVLVSKTAENRDPLSIVWLASRLKGAAHVLVEQSVEECSAVRAFCGKSEEPFGGVWIYYPSGAVRCRKFYYRSATGNEDVRLEKVIRNVIEYGIAQRREHLLTWNGVVGARLNDQLMQQISVRMSAESARKKAEDEIDKIYDTFDEDLRDLQEKVAELTKANEALQYENQGLRARYADAAVSPLLYMGDEEEFFQGEIRDMILNTLDEAMSNTETGTRRADLLRDIRDNNPSEHLVEERRQRIKTLLKGYKNMTGTMRMELHDLGFEITEEGKHYKLTYHGDPRYMVIMGKTPSDNRSGSNTAAKINKKIL